MIEIDEEKYIDGFFEHDWMQMNLDYENEEEVIQQLYAQMMGWA